MSGRQIPPTFIGIGAKKCATPWLPECLRDHPVIFISSPKELNFFGNSETARGIDAYLSRFSRARECRAVVEFSSTYLANPCTADEIRRAVGKVKIIACIGNPIDRLLSEYKQLMRRGLVAEHKVSTR